MTDSPSPVFRIVEGARKPFLEMTYENLDLSAYQSVTLVMRRADGTTVEIEADFDDAVNGVFHFEWGEADLIVGQHTADIVLVDGDGLEEVVPDEAPLLVLVRKRAKPAAP